MAMKERLKIKSRLQRYDVNIPRPGNGFKYTKCKMCLGIVMIARIKQHLSKISSSIHENVKQH